MIPVTYPSSVSTSKESQMVVFALSSVAGLQRWTDYIPVKFQSTGSDVPNSFNTNGYIACDFITSLTGKQAWVDYVPVFVDNAATTAWQVSDTGFIPFNTLAGGGTYVSLDLNFLNTAALDSRITFSRGTNATLTDSNGRIAWAPHNLLTNSEDFEAAGWTKSTGTVTSNATTAPDGTITADKFINATTANNVRYITQTVASSIGVFSVYAKAAEESVISLWLVGASVGAVFNLANGTFTLNGATSAQITPEANGWYRCTVYHNTATTTAHIYLRNGSAYTPTSASDGVFLWGAQLNIGSTAQSYNSTTPKNLLGFTQEPENAAWTKSNSYVQQNLLTWSQDFDNAAWVRSGITTITPNATTAPDGSVTADRYVESNLNEVHSLSSASVSATSGVTYTLSVYAKDAGRFLRLILPLAVFGNAVSANFDLVNGVAYDTAGTGATIQNVGSGWYRCAIRVTATTTASGAITVSTAQTSSGTGSYAGDGTSGVFIWGAQLVQGSTAGDYTQTTSAAAPTRYTNWDGTLTGRKLVENTVAAVAHRVQQTVVFGSAPIAGSAYLKAAEREWGYIRFDDATSTKFAYFDLTTGVVGTVSSGLTATVENAGGGWYRCSAVFASPAATASGTVVVGITTANNTATYTGDGTSGIYVSDFQLSNSASVDPYVYNPQAAAASAAYYGPRFDYDPVTLASRGLLIEEARANLFVRSEEFDVTANWTPSNLTVTANTDTAPNGTLSADTLTATAANAVIQQAASVTNATVYTYSVWIKRKTGTGAVALSDLNGNYFSVTVDATWTRFSLTSTAASTTGRGYIRLTTSGDEVYVWGAQLEAGSFATSYIPTVASQVTRNPDSASMLGDNFYTWYNQNQGTIYYEGDRIVGASSRQLSISDGTSSNAITLYSVGTDTLQYATGVVSGMPSWDLSRSPVSSGVSFKKVLGYAPNNVAFVLNGGTPSPDNTTANPPVDRMLIGQSPAGANAQQNQHIRSIRYYNTRLPDSTLQAMTT